MKKQRGFIALISSLILGAIMISLALGASTSSYFARADSLAGEFLVRANAYADSCLQVALKNMVNNSNPQAYVIQNQIIAINSNNDCLIASITHSGILFTIIANGTVGSSFITKKMQGHFNADSSIVIDMVR